MSLWDYLHWILLLVKEYINRTGCNKGLEKKQTVILLGLGECTIQEGIHKGP